MTALEIFCLNVLVQIKIQSVGKKSFILEGPYFILGFFWLSKERVLFPEKEILTDLKKNLFPQGFIQCQLSSLRFLTYLLFQN